jgi:hypothetical protein
VLGLTSDAPQFVEAGNVHYRAPGWPVTQGREEVGASRQNLPSGIGQHAHRFTKCFGPEIHEITSRMSSLAHGRKQFFYKPLGLYSRQMAFVIL